MTADGGGSPRREAIAMVRSRLGRERMGGRVARGAFKTILVNGSGAGVSFVVQVLLARSLGRDGFGTYLLAIGWLSVALLFGKLELDTTSVRFVGSYVATARWNLLRGFLRSSRYAVLVTSLALAMGGGVIIGLFLEPLRGKHPDFPAALLVACPMLPVVALLMLEGSVLQGLQRYAQAQLPLNVLRPLAFGILVVLLSFMGGVRMTAPMAVGANFFGAFLALALTWAWRRQAMPPEVRVTAPAYDRPVWARTAFTLAAVGIGQQIISHQTDVIVVGTMLSTTDAAVYGAASQLTMPLVLAASSVTFVAQPLIADLYSRGEPARLQSLIRVVTWASVGLAVPVALALIGFGPWLLRLYGAGFEDGHQVLVILTVSQLVVGLVGALAGFMLTMTAHERDAAWIIGWSALLNIGLALFLTPRLGAVGTASATLTAALVRAVALSVYVRRTMGLRLPAL